MRRLGILPIAFMAIAANVGSAIAQTTTARLTVAQVILPRSQPARISSSPAGIEGICSSPCNASFSAGTRVTLTVTSPQFEWDGACKGQAAPTCVLTMDADKSAVADFGKGTTTLTVRFDEYPDRPNGFITIDPDPQGMDIADCMPDRACVLKYRPGTVVTIRPHNFPNTDEKVIAEWGGDCAGQGTGECRLTMSKDMLVAGTWKYTKETDGDTELAIVSNNGIGAYQITPPDRLFNDCRYRSCKFRFPNGTRVKLVANESSGLLFDHWEGCDEPQGLTCTMVMSKGKTLHSFWTSFRRP